MSKYSRVCTDRLSLNENKNEQFEYYEKYTKRSWLLSYSNVVWQYVIMKYEHNY